MNNTQPTVLHRIGRGATTILLATAAVTFVLVLLAQLTGHYRFVPVLSGSMSPFVDAGDLAVLRPHAAADLEVGDVIAFEAPVDGSPLTLHRVIEIVRPWPQLSVRTQGDANDAADPWTARLVGDQMWRATSKVDHIGTPLLFLNRASTRFVLMSLGALLIGWWGLYAIWRRPEDDDDDDDPTVHADDENDHDHDGAGTASDEREAEYPTRHVDGETVDDSPTTGRPTRPRLRPAGIGARALTLLALVAVMFGTRGPAASSSFTGATVGSQSVGTAEASAPFTLEADLLCSAGIPEGIRLQWTAAANPVAQYVVYRGTVTGGPYDAVVGVTDGDTFTFTDPLTGLSGIPLHYVVRTRDVTFPEEQTNEAFAVAVCETLATSTTVDAPPLGL